MRPGLSEAMFLLAVLWPLWPARRISPATHSLGLGRYYWALLEVHRKHSTRETPEMPICPPHAVHSDPFLFPVSLLPSFQGHDDWTQTQPGPEGGPETRAC